MAERKMSEAASGAKIPIPAPSFRECQLEHVDEHIADKKQQHTTHLGSGSLPRHSPHWLYD